MYVLNEAFDGWYIPKTYHDYARWFDEDWKKDITAMVESSRNHPCVIMYSHGNEVSETATERGIKTCKELTDFIHELDNTRPVTAGINVLLNVYTQMGMGVYKETKKYRPEPIPAKNAYKEKRPVLHFQCYGRKAWTTYVFMSKGGKGDRACLGAANGLDVLGLNYASSRYDEDVKNILTGLWLALRQWLQIYLTTGNVLKNILSYWVISYGLPGIILGRHASVTGRIIPIRDFRCLPDRE